MNIVFVRGPFLNPWELQTYTSIAAIHSFRAIGGDWQFYANPIQIPNIPVAHARIWGKTLHRAFNGSAVLYNRALSWTFGRSYGLKNLSSLALGADILHSAELFFTLTDQCVDLKERMGCKLAVTVWENLPHSGERHPWRRERKARAIRAADGILAVTETSKRMLLSEGVPSERIAVIPMAVDTNRFSPKPKNADLLKRMAITEHDVVVLFIGRLVEEKGVHELLRCATVISKLPLSVPVRFCMVGDGPLRKTVESAASTLSNVLTYRPFLPYDDLPDLHNLADIFILPSKAAPQWEEQFGYVLVESMASGSAIVTTNSGSIPDVVGDAAIRVEPGKAKPLLEAITELAKDKRLRQQYGRLALLRAQSRFTLQAVTPLLEAFYENIRNGQPVGLRS